MLHNAIFLATCLATLEKGIHCRLQETCGTLQPRAAICNGFKKSLQSLGKVEPISIACVTRSNFLCNLCCNGVARQLEGILQCVTYPLCSLSYNSLGLATITQKRARYYLLQ